MKAWMSSNLSKFAIKLLPLINVRIEFLLNILKTNRSIKTKFCIYCGFRNFRVTFISRFFHFRIIREFLNSRASIPVVGHFCGLKIGALCISCERLNVKHRIAANAVCKLKLEILFVLLSSQKPPTITQFVTHTDSHWTASASIIRYSITLNWSFIFPLVQAVDYNCSHKMFSVV